MSSFDRTDLKLIRMLQDQPRASHADLSRMTGISVSTVRRRVEHLLESKAITHAVYPNVRMIGYRAICLLGINADFNCVENIANQLKEIEEVTLVVVTLGRYNLFASIALHNIEDMYPFLKERIASIPGINDIETFVSASAVKDCREWRIPIADLEGIA